MNSCKSLDFQDLEKVLKMEIKSRKIIQSLEVFFIAEKSAWWVNFFPVVNSIYPVAKTFNHRMRSFIIFFVPIAPWLQYVCSAPWKKLGSCVFSKVSIDHLFDNLESGDIDSRIGKKSGKSLEFWVQNSVWTLKRIIRSMINACLLIVILSEIVNFSNLFQHYVLLFSLIRVLFCQGCKRHDVAPDGTGLDCLRSKCNIGRCVDILIVVILNYIQKHKGDFLTFS